MNDRKQLEWHRRERVDGDPIWFALIGDFELWVQVPGTPWMWEWSILDADDFELARGDLCVMEDGKPVSNTNAAGDEWDYQDVEVAQARCERVARALLATEDPPRAVAEGENDAPPRPDVERLRAWAVAEYPGATSDFANHLRMVTGACDYALALEARTPATGGAPKSAWWCPKCGPGVLADLDANCSRCGHALLTNEPPHDAAPTAPDLSRDCSTGVDRARIEGLEWEPCGKCEACLSDAAEVEKAGVVSVDLQSTVPDDDEDAGPTLPAGATAGWKPSPEYQVQVDAAIAAGEKVPAPGIRHFGKRSDGAWGCDTCCTGDRCDDPTHFSRRNCPVCSASGAIPDEFLVESTLPAAPETGQERKAEGPTGEPHSDESETHRCLLNTDMECDRCGNPLHHPVHTRRESTAGPTGEKSELPPEEDGR